MTIPTQPKNYCECTYIGTLSSESYACWYDEETELPFVNHRPCECGCTNELKLYQRGNEILTLCSICHTFGDKEITP